MNVYNSFAPAKFYESTKLPDNKTTEEQGMKSGNENP